MTPANIVLIIVGVLLTCAMPSAAQRYVLWKCQLKEREAPECGKKKLYLWMGLGTLCWLGFAFYIGQSATPGLLFGLLFYEFALFGSFVDAQMRIIGNEMLIAMLIVGVIYRLVMCGGPMALLNSLYGLLMAVGVFIGAAALNFLFVKRIGVGMGDMKLVGVIGIIVGFPGVVYFMVGLGLAVVAFFLLISRRLAAFKQFYMQTFAMCGPMMLGFLFAIGPHHLLIGF